MVATLPSTLAHSCEAANLQSEGTADAKALLTEAERSSNEYEAVGRRRRPHCADEEAS